MFSTKTRVSQIHDTVMNEIIQKEEKEGWMVNNIGQPFAEQNGVLHVIITFSKDVIDKAIEQFEESTTELG